MKSTKILKAALATALVTALPLAASATTTAPAPFNVVVNLTGACTLTGPAANYTFNITAGSAYAGSSVSQNIGVTCTNGLPYTIQVDATATSPVAGTAVGIPYNITWPTAAQTGSGAAQTHALAVAVAAGTYAGDCTTAGSVVGGVCSKTDVHQVTVVY